VVRAALLLLAVLVLLPLDADRAWARDYGYEVPVAQDSPWPSMRRDRRNTGASPIVGRYRGDRPWAFRTAKGIFSTPVLGGDGTVYIGSADRSFYALDRFGLERWRFGTGEIIDSAATLGAYDRKRRTMPVTFGSGDERLYRLRTDPAPVARRRRIIWRRARRARPPPASS
jgi:outer membrane protein assembly factor BamB